MSGFFKHDGCNKAIIKKIQDEIGISFPLSYIEFLGQSNGGEGTDRNNRYIRLWRCEDILQYNKDYAVQRYLPKGVVAFGMDGDRGYFFDCREKGEPPIMSCSFGDLDIAELKLEAHSFDEFIEPWM